MDDFLGILLFGVVVFVIFMVAFVIGALIRSAGVKKMKQYLKAHFPQLPDEVEILAAKQKSKKAAVDIGMVINDAAKEIIVLGKSGSKELQHRVFPFDTLTSVESSHQVITRGALWQKTFSYEQTMVVKFADGSSFNFILENISNRAGNDKGSQAVIELFAPWERKLKAILQKE